MYCLLLQNCPNTNFLTFYAMFCLNIKMSNFYCSETSYTLVNFGFSFFHCLLTYSECWVWPSGLAALLPSCLSSLPQPQLCGSPGGSGCWSDSGCSGPAELWAAPPGAVPVLDLFLCVHFICALRRLLEHICVQLTRCATAASTMTWVFSPGGTFFTAWLEALTQPWTEPHCGGSERYDRQQLLWLLSSWLPQPTCYLSTANMKANPTCSFLDLCWIFVSWVSARGASVDFTALITAALIHSPHGLTSSASSSSIQRCLHLETSARWKYFCTVASFSDSCEFLQCKPF